MPNHTKKSTRKFEKNHLKDTLGRRKEFAKIKQRNQLKEKKRARRAKDSERASDNETEKAKEPILDKRSATQSDRLKDMTVDDFFQGGFEMAIPKKKSKKGPKTKLPEPKTGKRKRGLDPNDISTKSDSESNSSVEENPVLDDNGSGSEGEDSIGGHKDDLEALAKKDPDFYRYLKENDAELLDFAENADLAEVDELSESEEPRRKKKKTKRGEDLAGQEAENKASADVTLDMVDKWEDALSKEHSLRSLRQLVLAFRAAAHTNDDDKEYKYTISTPEVYHKLLVVALKNIPEVLIHHLPIKENASGRVRVPTDSKKYRTMIPLLISHATSLTHLLETLSDAPTLKLALSSILPLLPYFLSFKKVLKNLTKGIVDIWSEPSSTEATRINAFLLMRRLAVISDASLRETILKTTYQGLVRGSRNTTIHTLAGINLMKNSAVELWGLDPSLGYTTGFTYIRQLAIHLRASIAKPTKDSYKAVYNWQYTHSLDFWSRVLSIHCSPAAIQTLKKPSDSALHPLIYPLVQITLGALRLIPTPTYFPLRFHLARSLLRVSRSTETYIPLAPSLIEVLQSPELKNAPKPSTLKPLDFSTSLRAPKSYTHTRVYQDGVGEQVSELLAEFFGIWAKNIAFPELVIPPSVLLKRWLKDVSSQPSKAGPNSNANGKSKGNKNSKLTGSISLLVQKLSANAFFVENKRRKVEYAVNDRAGVESFLSDVKWEDMPLGAYVEGMRKQKEERERVLEEGRKDEENRRAIEREKRGDDEEDASDGMEDLETNMEEKDDTMEDGEESDLGDDDVDMLSDEDTEDEGSEDE